MATLYDLTQDYAAVLAMAEDPDADAQAVLDTLEGIEGEFEDKADGYAMLIRELAADAEKLAAEETRLSRRKKALENHAERIKTRLEDAMRETGKREFRTTLFSFGIQRNPPRLVLDAPDAVPEEYQIPQPPKVNGKAILAAIKDGATFDFAHAEQGESLRIR